MESCPDRVRHDLLDLHDYVAFHVDLLVRVGHGEVPLQLAVAELVAGLVLAVILRVLLHGVVDQVDELVVEVWSGGAVLLGGGTDVAVAVEVGLQDAVHASHEGEAADVEFTALDEERVVDVLLEDHGAVAAAVLMHKIPDSANLLLHLDASSSIRVLARLDDPDVLAILVPLAVEALLLVVFLKSVVFSIVLSILDVESQW